MRRSCRLSRRPPQCTHNVVCQRKGQIKVHRRHVVAMMMQAMQMRHCRQAWHEPVQPMTIGQMIAKVKCLIEHVGAANAGQPKPSGISRDKMIKRPCARSANKRDNDDNQPCWKQHHAPVAWRLPLHIAVGEKAVVVAGMALVKKLGPAFFAMPKA